MAITTQTVKVDLNTGKVLPVVYAHQNDTNRAIQFEVYNENAPFSLSGYTVKFGYVSPKVHGAYTVIAGDGMASGSVSGNTVTFNIPESYLEIAGIGLLTMIISGSGASIRPVNIRFEVQTSADGSGVMAGASDFPDAWMDEKVYSWLDDHIEGIFTEEQFTAAVDNWLDNHPEATTTVEDGSITASKLHNSLQIFATPEMYGARGDGATDDTSAWQSALDNAKIIFCNPASNYLITSVLRIKANTTIFMNNCTVTCNQKRWLFNFLDTDEFTGYNGNDNIRIVNGIVYGGSVSFWHGENISFERVHFKNCLNDHFFEISACNNFVVEKCSLVGMKEFQGSTHEYINIDPNGTTSGTYFTGNSYPTANYSGTRNKNIYIRKNIFNINEDDTNFQAQDNPFGCHLPIGNYHENVQFIENTCLNYKDCAVRFSDFENSVIARNYFKSNLCSNPAIKMLVDNGMAYSNINCIIEDNTIYTTGLGAEFANSKGLVFRRNSYEDLSYSNRSIGTFGTGNEFLSFYNNVSAKNTSPSLIAFDDGDYTGVEASPFDILQFTRVGKRTVTDNSVTLGNLRWTFFNKIYLQFTNSPKTYEISAWPDNVFHVNNNYPIIQDPVSNQVLAYIRIDGDNPSKISVNFASGVQTQNVQTVYVEKTIGTRPTS